VSDNVADSGTFSINKSSRLRSSEDIFDISRKYEGRIARVSIAQQIDKVITAGVAFITMRRWMSMVFKDQQGSKKSEPELFGLFDSEPKSQVSRGVHQESNETLSSCVSTGGSSRARARN